MESTNKFKSLYVLCFSVLVPFGWGQNPEDNENEFENRIEVSDRATLKGSLAAINPLAMIQRRRSGVVTAATSVSGTVTRAGTAGR